LNATEVTAATTSTASSDAAITADFTSTASVYEEFTQWKLFIDADLYLKEIFITIIFNIRKRFKRVEIEDSSRGEQEAQSLLIVQNVFKDNLNIFGIHIFLK